MCYWVKPSTRGQLQKAAVLDMRLIGSIILCYIKVVRSGVIPIACSSHMEYYRRRFELSGNFPESKEWRVQREGD